MTRHFDPPYEGDVAGTVFDPTSDTFAPIMAAIQRGDFEQAADALLAVSPSAVNDSPSHGDVASTAISEREPATLDVEALRELAHKEYEIAKLLGPSDEHEQAWLDYTERIVRLTDDYLATTRERTADWSTGKVDGSLGPIRHTSREAAEAWIAERERIDPEGVRSGAYYLDAPEREADDPPSQGDAATTATDAARDVAHRLAGFMAGDLFDLMDERDIDGAAWLTVEEQDTGRRFTVAVREVPGSYRDAA